jgi:hypothetical protein
MPTADEAQYWQVSLAYIYDVKEFKAASEWEMREVTII